MNINGKNPYNEPLQTQISDEQLTRIVKGFFEDFDAETFNKISNILDGKDNRFNLSIDEKWNGESSVSNPNTMPIDIKVGKYSDLRTVYELVHELTHCLDVENGETTTRRVLGEVAPQCMERLVDFYLIENCNLFGMDKGKLEEDIDKRKFTTFISRAQNAIDFTSKVGNREKNSRYVLAQLYQSELMKNSSIQAKIKLVNYINCVKNNNFEGANHVLGIKLEKSSKLQRENIVMATILEGENLYKKTSKIKDIDVVNIDDIDLNNSYFHFTSKDNLEQILVDGLKPRIGDASKLKSEEKPRVYLSKGGKGIIEIKNSFIHEFKKLKVCDIPLEYRKYFNIDDYSIKEQVDEKSVYDAMEKRFKDEIYIKVDSKKGEDFIIEDQFNEAFLEDFSKESLEKMFDKGSERDIKGNANHSIETKKLSLIKTNRGNTSLDIVEYLYDKLLQNAKQIGNEDIVRWANSDLDGLFEYIKQRDRIFDER